MNAKQIWQTTIERLQTKVQPAVFTTWFQGTSAYSFQDGIFVVRVPTTFAKAHLEGRFVDFVQQELAAFGDADIGAAARVVHEGCRRAIRAHAKVVSVRNEAEGTTLTLERASADVKLVGNVAGSAPFRGVLRHKGWRVLGLTLPTVVGAHDPTLVAPAELELP